MRNRFLTFVVLLALFAQVVPLRALADEVSSEAAAREEMLTETPVLAVTEPDSVVREQPEGDPDEGIDPLPEVENQIVVLEDSIKDFSNVVPQTTEYTCGPAALATLILLKGGAVTDEMTVSELSGTTEDSGTTLLGLKKAATSLGYDVKMKRWGIGALRSAALPVLVNDRAPDGSAHYSVVVGFTESTVRLADTKLGNIELDLTDFEKTYAGTALLITPKTVVQDGMSLDAVATILDANSGGAIAFDQEGNVIPVDQIDDVYDEEASTVSGKGGVDVMTFAVSSFPVAIRIPLQIFGVTSVTAVIGAGGEVIAVVGAGVLLGALGYWLVSQMVTAIGELVLIATAPAATVLLAENVGSTTLDAAKAIPASIGRCMSSEWHHILTDKNYRSASSGGPWSPVFKAMLDLAGMTFNDPLNLVDLAGHCGPHPREYHEEVARRLQEATNGLTGSKYARAFRSALIKIGKEILTQGSRLNKLLVK